MTIPLTGMTIGGTAIPTAANSIYLHNLAAYFCEAYYAHYRFYDTNTIEFPILPWALKGFQQGRDDKPDLTSYTLYFPRPNNYESLAGASWLNYSAPTDRVTELIPGFQIIKA